MPKRKKGAAPGTARAPHRLANFLGSQSLSTSENSSAQRSDVSFALVAARSHALASIQSSGAAAVAEDALARFYAAQASILSGRTVA